MNVLQISVLIIAVISSAHASDPGLRLLQGTEMPKFFSASFFLTNSWNGERATLNFSSPLSNDSFKIIKENKGFKLDITTGIRSLNSKEYEFIIDETSNKTTIFINFTFKASFQNYYIELTLDHEKLKAGNESNIDLVKGSYVLRAKLPPFIKYSRQAQSFMDFMNGCITVILLFLLISFIPLSLIRSLGIFWSFLDMLQLLNILLYINADLPLQVIQFLRSLNISNFQVLEFSKNLLLKGELYYEDNNSIPSRFSQESVSTRFFQNAGIAAIVWISAVGIQLIFHVVFSLFQKNLSQNSWVRDINRVLEYSLAIRACQVTYTQLTLASTLQFRNISSESLGNVINSVIAIIAVTVLILFPIFSLYILNFSKINLESPESRMKFDSLYDMFVITAIFKKNFGIFLIIRKFLWVTFVVFLDYDPLNQVFGLICLSLFIMTLMILKRPYKDKKVNYMHLVTEFLILVVLILIAVMMSLDYLGSDIEINTRLDIGWTIVACFSIMIFIKLIFTIYEIVKNIGQLISGTKRFVKWFRKGNMTSGESIIREQELENRNNENGEDYAEISSYKDRSNVKLIND